MRTAIAGAVLLAAAGLVGAQPKKDPDPRYGVNPRVREYPQESPKAALRTAVKLIDQGSFAYLAAHVLDAQFVDAQVADRAKGFEAGAERELGQLREFQRANPDRVTRDNRVPLDPREFRAAAAEKARDRAFKQLLADIAEKLKDDPQAMKDMRKLLRDGEFAEADPVASVAHPDAKGRALYFKKTGDRWFLENKQADEPKKEP